MKDDFSSEEFEQKDKKIEVVTIPVIEEQLEVGKKMVETGNVKISKHVKEEEVTVNLSLESEEVFVDRIAINKYVENPLPAVREEGDTTIIPVLQEVLEKRVILLEEIHITKRKSEKEKTEKLTLRKEEVTIDKNNNKENKIK